MRILPLFTYGHDCPRCGHPTDRVRTHFYFRPVRWLLPDVRRRACGDFACGWRGFAFPLRVEEGAHAAVR
jgi:hypothetical protein